MMGHDATFLIVDKRQKQGENIVNARKRPYRKKIKYSACNKEIYNDNFPKHNKSVHNGNARIIHLRDPSQKKLIFSVPET